MEKSMLLEIIGDTMENKVLDFLVEGMGIEYTKKDIARGAGISRPTLYKILLRMEKLGLVKATRTIGRVRLYTLNRENGKVKALIALEEMLLKNSFQDVAEKIKIPA